MCDLLCYHKNFVPEAPDFRAFPPNVKKGTQKNYSPENMKVKRSKKSLPRGAGTIYYLVTTLILSSIKETFSIP